MGKTEPINDIYLKLQLRKSSGDNSSEYGKTDENGNYIFEVEASNENLDLQNQVVLQNALMESKDNFVQHGVISYDHLHKTKDENGNPVTDNSMIIGEPIDVIKNGKSTIVVGKLYKSNKKAQDFIRLLKDGSTRVRASVGGIFPKVVKDATTGIEKITHVLWNDLALTCMPVNNTVGNAVFAKAMNPDEFVKALAAGYETDSANMTGGNALIPESLGIKTVNVDESNEVEDEQKETIRTLIACLETGEIKGKEQAEKYLMSKGVDKDQSRQIVREIIEQGGQIMKSSFSSRIKEMMKSFGVKQKDDKDVKDEDEDVPNNVDDESDDETINLDVDTDDEDDSDEAETSTKSCKKSLADDEEDELVDGTKILKSINDEILSMHKSIEAVKKQYEDLGEAVLGLGEMVGAIGGEKLPPKSVGISKSLNGGEINSSHSGKKMTQEDYAFAQKALCDAVKNGEITIEKSCMWDSEIQKSMITGSTLPNECFSFLRQKWGSK